MLDIEKLLNELTIEEKASLLSGHKSWHSNKISRLDIPSIFLTDGPHGLRKKKETSKSMGLGETELSTCFPAASTTGCSWNKNILLKMGKAMGEECRGYGVNVILGPAVNIKRNPLCGRNFEYFSEDPLLTGKLGAALTKGIEQMGVATSVKHFACNNQEANRYTGDSIVDEKALREIYLKGFEIIVKEGKTQTLMCAYNKVNGEFASENKTLLTDILRKEWGFDGLVMSDWGAVNNRVLGLKAGLDLEMPGDIGHNRQIIVDAYNNGELEIEVLNQAVKNVLTLINKTYYKDKLELRLEEDSDLAYQVSVDSAVLLKNDENILPLKKEKKYLIVGDLFENMRYQGAGSSLINPYKLVTPKMAFEESDIQYEYYQGYNADSLEIDYELSKIALKNASYSDTVIFFGGLSEYAESEGFDRENLNLPSNQEYLLNELIKLNKNIIFVFYGGSPVVIPGYENIKSILAMYLPGQEGGRSTFDLLFGKCTPSGRLAETWPLKQDDVPFSSEFTKTANDIYKESIFVGYRYFNNFNIKTRFPFGYGLSYTEFAYSNMDIQLENDKYIVSVDVKNIGDISGSEVVQVYVNLKDSKIVRPKRELKGFTKIHLEPNETRRVEVIIPIQELKVFNLGSWVLESGEYSFLICKNADEVIIEKNIIIESVDEITVDDKYYNLYKDYESFVRISDKEMETLLGKKFQDPSFNRPYNLNTPICQYKSFGGKMIYKLIMFGCNFVLKRAKKNKSEDRETKVKNAYFTMKLMPFLSLRAMSYTSEGMLSHRRALGILDIVNNKFLRGIWKLITPEKVFKLPK